MSSQLGSVSLILLPLLELGLSSSLVVTSQVRLPTPGRGAPDRVSAFALVRRGLPALHESEGAHV